MLCWLLGMASICMAAGDTWTQKAPMPTARALLSSSVVDGKIYAIGGRQTNGASASSAVEQYDPATDTWTTKAPMPTARQWLSTSAVNGRIYAFGGNPRTYEPTLSTVEEYDPATDTWTEKAPMPTARAVLSTSVVDGKIYAIGGSIRKTTMTGGGETPSSAVEAYDPATDTWTTKAPMPTARMFLAAGVVNGKIYAIGGAIAAGGSTLSTVEEYDPLTDTWTTKASMQTRRATPSGASVVNGIIYVIGGVSGSTAFSTVEAYDPATDTWTERTSMPTARTFLATSAVNGKIYAIGGSLGSPWNGISTVEEYDLTPPPPDFNGDGGIDGKDVLILAENWGQDDPVCDIAPLPFGDGIVDVQDLIVLAEHIGKEVNDPTLIAHWALDEAEGAVAYDSAGQSDATVIGVPAWQPAGGSVDGALEFDGATLVVADSVLNPSDGPFSVFAWVKGGAPGQAVVSQEAGANWLMADAVTGELMTELRSGGRFSGTLSSETIIADGDWHRIGFTWDGSARSLYVDDVLVAEDTQTRLADCQGGLNIGCGKDMAPGTFFFGLIDDVRIYNRALRP
jgi:N-acetylneuraminic acid mutarotase